MGALLRVEALSRRVDDECAKEFTAEDESMTHPRAVLQTQLDVVVFAGDLEGRADDWTQRVVATCIAHPTPLVERALNPVSVLGQTESHDLFHAVVGKRNLLGMECVGPGASVHLRHGGTAFEFRQADPLTPA